jgi:hypothetical protein
MKALVFQDKVVEVAENEFPVYKDLVWMDAPEGCEDGWLLEDGVLVAPPARPEPTYDKNRYDQYPHVREQLDLLYHEMTVSGSLTTSGSWYKTIKTVKDANPKP